MQHNVAYHRYKLHTVWFFSHILSLYSCCVGHTPLMLQSIASEQCKMNKQWQKIYKQYEKKLLPDAAVTQLTLLV